MRSHIRPETPEQVVLSYVVDYAGKTYVAHYYS